MESSRKASVKKSAYLFECKGIQRYIFGSGRLRQVIGASDLIAGVARSDGEDVLKPVFEAVGIENPAMSRRAGAAFCAHADNEALGRFRRLWRLVVGVRYPGLEFSDIEPVDADSELEAAQLAYSRLTAVRENSTAFLPPAGHPFVTMNPRTGLVAVGRPRQDKDSSIIDAVGAPAHQRGEALGNDAKVDRLAADFLPKPESGVAADPPWRFPRHFEATDATARNPAFPFTGQRPAHRCGPRRSFRSRPGLPVPDGKHATSSQDIFAVATAIERCDRQRGPSSACKPTCCCPTRSIRPATRNDLGRICSAARTARTLPTSTRCASYRRAPILLGGDDLTVIVRADIAIAFSEHFLQCVETQTEKCELARSFKERFPGLPERLSACAGIAIVTAGPPVHSGRAACGGICAIRPRSRRRPLRSARRPLPVVSRLRRRHLDDR